MLGISYTYRGLLCEGLSSQNVDRGYALFESLPYDIASRDTNLQFSFLVPEVSIFCYFGILNDGFDRPHERCRGYSLYVRLPFFKFRISFLCFGYIVRTDWISAIGNILVIVAIELRDVEDLLIVTHFKARESVGLYI